VIGGNIDPEPGDRRMGEEIAAEERMVRSLDRAALAPALDALGATTARPVQAEPATAATQPALDGIALRRIGVGTGDIGAPRLPLADSETRAQSRTVRARR
jgi:hypothetical protein